MLGALAGDIIGSVPTAIQKTTYDLLDDKLRRVTQAFMTKYCS